MEHTPSRRKFLQATGTATAIGLAGCSTDNGETNPSTPTDDETNEEDDTTNNTPDPDPEYSLEASLRYDLTDLEIDTPQTVDEEYVEENYSSTPEVTLLENGSETSLEQLSEVHLETEEGEEIRPDEEIPEYAIEEGEKVYVTGETENGETVETETQVEKSLPNEYVREVYVDGSKEPWHDWVQNITGETPEEYSTPFRFDNQQFTFQEFYEIRREMVEDLETASGLGFPEARKAARNTDWNQFNNKQEKIAEASRITNSEMPGASAAAQNKAQMMEHILRHHTDISEPIAAGGFNNPADESHQGNHGSQMIHADGDNYHSETRNHWPEDQARHVDNIEDTVMMSSAAQSAFVSVIGELSRDFEQVNEGNGISGLSQLIGNFTATDNIDNSKRKHSTEQLFQMRDLIRQNKFEEALLGNMIGVTHAKKTGQKTVTLDTGNTILPVSTTGSLSNQAEEKLK